MEKEKMKRITGMETPKDLKPEQQVQDKQEPRAYTKEEEIIVNNANKLFDLTNSLIQQTRDALLNVWDIDRTIVPDRQIDNPIARLIEMFKWYVNEWETNHAKFLKNNNLKMSKDDKSKLKDIDKNKPAEIKPAKQVNKLILG